MTETVIDNGWQSLPLLARFLLDTDHTAEEIVYAMEKPWKYESAVEALKRYQDQGQPWELVVKQVAKDYADA